MALFNMEMKMKMVNDFMFEFIVIWELGGNLSITLCYFTYIPGEKWYTSGFNIILIQYNLEIILRCDIGVSVTFFWMFVRQ